MIEPVLDHAVIDVRDSIDEAARLFRRLGFALTGRGHHSLGSANHLATFGTNYLELLGWESGVRNARPELAAFPIGLNGLVFRAEDADAVSDALTGAGLPAQAAADLSRPVRLANGAKMEARFRTVRFEPHAFGSMRISFCQHLTPELVWRDEWLQHANGARDVARVIIQAAQPHRIGTLFATMFGEDRIRLEGERCVLEARNARIEAMPRAEIAHAFRDAAPDLGSRDEAPAVLTLRSASVPAAAAALAAEGIPSLQIGKGRIVVPAAAALNVTLEFVE